MSFVESKDLIFEYKSFDEEKKDYIKTKAVDRLNLKIEEGEFVAILGHNGSGKSTLARLINALLIPTDGMLLVNGLDSNQELNVWEIRKSAGMVFQNPDNQIVATIVEEDVAFGSENLGVEPATIRERVDYALRAVKMDKYKAKSVNTLSGGQKQRIAIAGILAMKPKCIIFDEPTAMLDPIGRKDVMQVIKKLNKDENITVIFITHFMEEAVSANRIIVMEKGKCIMEGTPRQIFSQRDKMLELKLDIPQVTELAYRLNKSGFKINTDILTIDKMKDNLLKIGFKDKAVLSNTKLENNYAETLIEVQHLTHIYGEGTVFEKTALNDINFNIKKGEFVGIIGHTGSGKSTLIQHLNALVKPTSGAIFFDGQDINADKEKLRAVREKVGLVFQYPEQQLFELTVYKDVAFGPKNLGLTDDEIDLRVKAALEVVGIRKELYEKSPFELSGGQKRRVAIAGILAVQPEVLILDEPTAGLDPYSRDEILNSIFEMRKRLNLTVVLVSHSMEDVAKFADRILVLHDGSLEYFDNPQNVFSHNKHLSEIGLMVPQISTLMHSLKGCGVDVPTEIFSVDDACTIFKVILNKGENI